MTRALSFRDVLVIVEKVPDLSGIVLVGGQALNFWAETLGIATATSRGRFGPATSYDIDFLASAKAALAFGHATGGEVQVAGMEHAHSPNTALVTLDINGEQHLVDFLGAMRGFSPQELERVSRWAVPLTLERGAPAPISVMHPAHCLEAQLENVYGLALNRRAAPGGARYVRRVRLAIEACRRITLRHLEAGDARSALRVAEKVHALSLLPSAMRARFEDDLRVEDGIANEPTMPAEFLRERLPRLRRAHELKMQRYQRARKGGGKQKPAAKKRVGVRRK